MFIAECQIYHGYPTWISISVRDISHASDIPIAYPGWISRSGAQYAIMRDSRHVAAAVPHVLLAVTSIGDRSPHRWGYIGQNCTERDCSVLRGEVLSVLCCVL